MKHKALAFVVALVAAFAATPSRATGGNCVVQCADGYRDGQCVASLVVCQNFAASTCDCQGGNYTYDGDPTTTPPPLHVMYLQATC